MMIADGEMLLKILFRIGQIVLRFCGQHDEIMTQAAHHFVPNSGKMTAIKGYQMGMVESKIHRDALLLTVVKDFSTANRNVGGNAAATFVATQSATQRQRAGNAHRTSL